MDFPGAYEVIDNGKQQKIIHDCSNWQCLFNPSQASSSIWDNITWRNTESRRRICMWTERCSILIFNFHLDISVFIPTPFFLCSFIFCSQQLHLIAIIVDLWLVLFHYGAYSLPFNTDFEPIIHCWYINIFLSFEWSLILSLNISIKRATLFPVC